MSKRNRIRLWIARRVCPPSHQCVSRNELCATRVKLEGVERDNTRLLALGAAQARQLTLVGGRGKRGAA